MRKRPLHALAAAFFALAAVRCTSQENGEAAGGGSAPPRAEVLTNVPVMLGSGLLDTTGTEDAERRTYVAQAPLDSAAAFYRRILPGIGWQVVGDRGGGDAATIDLHYRKADAALWVQLRRLDPVTTEYTLIGTSGRPVAGDTVRRR